MVTTNARPVANAGTNCPLYKQDVSEVCHKCEWFTQLKGAHPQTGEQIDSWGCAIAWLPVLTIEAAKESRSAGKAIEEFRNVMVKLNVLNLKLLGAQK